MSKHHKGFSSVLVLLVVVIVIGLAGFWWVNNNKTSNAIVEDRATAGTTESISDSSTRYVSSEWHLAFTYPTHWKLVEQKYNEAVTQENGLARVTVSGDGYTMSFSTIGKDYPVGVKTTTHEYVVDGKKVTALEDTYGEGFMQRIPVCEGVYIDVSSPVLSKDVTDKIIASIDCSPASI